MTPRRSDEPPIDDLLDRPDELEFEENRAVPSARSPHTPQSAGRSPSPRSTRNRRGLRLFWRENGVAISWPITVFLILLAIAAWCANVFTNYLLQHQVDARMGPRMNLVALPEMSMRVMDGRQVDVTVKVELTAGVDGGTLVPKANRIYDRLVDEMAGLSSDALDGAKGATFVKAAAETAVREEYDTTKVKGVYIDKLLVH